MPVTAQQRLTNAYNEFIRDYVEAHGQNQATRDEAHERAAWCVSLGQAVSDLFDRFNLEKGGVDFVTESLPNVMPEEAYLVACAVAVALEEVK